MKPQATIALSQVLEHYYSEPEFLALADAFNWEVPDVDWGSLRETWLTIARTLIDEADSGQSIPILTSLLRQMEVRNADAVANSQWEARVAEEERRQLLWELREALSVTEIKSEVASPSGSNFSAKSNVRDLVSQATRDLLVVDPYIGVGTLDCLLTATIPIRLLTADRQRSIEKGFDRHLDGFRKEGFLIEVRTASGLHDRHIAFNGRCWLIGSSLKDAGMRGFNCIELKDRAAFVIGELKKQWSQGNIVLP